MKLSEIGAMAEFDRNQPGASRPTQAPAAGRRTGRRRSSRARPAMPVVAAPRLDEPALSPTGDNRIKSVFLRRLCAWTCLAGLCALGMYYMMMPVFNGDFGWHAALGRYVVENHTVPTTEPFSHTARGVPMVAHEWLSQVAYHLIIKAAGVLGLRWVHASLVALMLIWLYGLLRRESAARALAVCGVCLFFVLAHDRFQHRPYMFQITLLLLMYGYLFVYRPALTAGQLVGIFVVMVVWANAHAGVVLFSALVVLYVMVECGQQKLGWRRPSAGELAGGDLRRLGLLALIAVVALVITPNHVRLFPYLIESKRFNSTTSSEWLPILDFWSDPSLKYSVRTFVAVAGATLIAAGLTIRRRGLAETAVVVFLTLLPLTGLRFIAAAFAPILLLLPELSRWSSYADVPSLRRLRRLARQLAPVAALLLVSATLYPVLWDKVTPYRQRLSADWNFHKPSFPIEAMDFLDSVKLEGRLFNPKRWGGYVLFRTYLDYPIFMDGRWITFGPKLFEDSRTIRWKKAGAEEKLDEYGIDILLVHRDYVTADRSDREKWTPVFENYNSGVYLRNSRRNARNFRKCAEYYRAHGIPFNARGFDERTAYMINRDWAEEAGVSRNHISMGQRMMVRGW